MQAKDRWLAHRNVDVTGSLLHASLQQFVDQNGWHGNLSSICFLPATGRAPGYRITFLKKPRVAAVHLAAVLKESDPRHLSVKPRYPKRGFSYNPELSGAVPPRYPSCSLHNPWLTRGKVIIRRNQSELKSAVHFELPELTVFVRPYTPFGGPVRVARELYAVSDVAPSRFFTFNPRILSILPRVYIVGVAICCRIAKSLSEGLATR